MLRNITIILIYFFLFAFWAENSLGFKLTQIPGLSLTNLVVYFLLIAWAYTVVFKRRLLEPSGLNTCLILLIFIVVLSIPYKIFLADSIKISIVGEIVDLKNWANQFIIFFIVYNIINDEITCKRALLGLVFLLFITGLSTPLISLGLVDIGNIYHGRAAGFAEPNQYAAYLVLFIPLIVTFVLFHKNKIFQTFCAFVLIVSFVALITTGSRGGLFSFLFSLITYLFILYQEKTIRLSTLFSTLLAVILISAISLVVSPPEVKEIIFSRMDPAQSEGLNQYTAGRLNLWRHGLKLFVERPIFGHGKGTFPKLMDARFGLPFAAHNHYLNYLVQFGIVGLSVFILVFFRLVRVPWRYQKSTKDYWKKKIYISYIAGLIGYACSMFAVNLSNPREILWIYSAVVLKYGKLGETIMANEFADNITSHKKA